MRKSSVLFALIVLSCLASSVLAAEKPEVPKTLPGGKVLTVQDAKALLDKKGAKFFDMRSAVNFGKGHIPGATALPYAEKSDFTANFDSTKDTFEIKQLPPDKKAAIIFYSDGTTGWKSYKAAVLAIKAGYKNVNWMRDGYAGWVKANYPSEE